MMTFQSVPEAIPIAIASVFSCALACFAWRRQAMPLAPAFAIMMAGETAWALGAALEPIIAELPIKRLCIDLRILGTVTGILGLVAFVFRYTGLFRWLKAGRFLAICAPAVPLIALAWTDPWHHLYWAQLSNERIGGLWLAIRSYAPGFWAMVAYCYALATVSTFLLVQGVIRSSGVYRVQIMVMLFGVLLPWVVDILKTARLIPFMPVDLVSLTFAVTGLSFLPAVLRFHLLDLPPIAWAAVVKGMDDPVVVIGPSGGIVALNAAAQRLIGASSPAFIGLEAARAFERWPKLAERIARLAGGAQSLDLAGIDPDLVSAFDARISALGDEAQRGGWVLVLRDVTGLKRAQEERVSMLREQAARVEAEAANRAKDRFLATLSHELRTPLTPVLATVTAMLEDPTTPSELASVLEMIRRNVTLEARLIDDLLDMTRIRGGKLHLQRSVVDAHALIHQVVEMGRGDLRDARLELTLDLAAQRHNLDADPARLKQVLWNLLKNAIKFTSAGGTMTIRSRDSDASLDGLSGPTLIIEVHDAGIGIEAADLPGIFDVFEHGGLSRSRRRGGLGLGLMISRSIVEQHGGRLTATSGGKNLGATFRIEMPGAGSPPLAALPSEPRTAPPRLARRDRPLKILLVEDNLDALNSLAKILSARGDHVRTAASLSSALQVASEGDFDLLISDIQLPDGSGLELMWQLRSSRPVYGIALSGFGSSEDIEQSRSAGFAEHLTKPVDFRRLDAAIQQVAASSRAERLVTG
jgi:signal transduction histidine kinase/ActR/RegA family two-component response regulator